MKYSIKEVEFNKPVALAGCGQHTRVAIDAWRGSGPSGLCVLSAEWDSTEQQLVVARSDGDEFIFPAVAVVWMKSARTMARALAAAVESLPLVTQPQPPWTPKFVASETVADADKAQLSKLSANKKPGRPKK